MLEYTKLTFAESYLRARDREGEKERTIMEAYSSKVSLGRPDGIESIIKMRALDRHDMISCDTLV